MMKKSTLICFLPYFREELVFNGINFFCIEKMARLKQAKEEAEKDDRLQDDDEEEKGR